MSKIMTTEEKAKAYDEALERAKNLHKDAIDMEENRLAKQCEIIFPELKESEDEKIRKAIVDALNKNLGNGIEKYGTTLNAALTWLEKQGKYKDTFPIPTRETILSIWELGNDWKDITHGSISTKYGTQLEYIQKHWQESEYYLEKQGEQKPTSDTRYEVKDGDSLSVNGKPFDYEKATITQKDFAPKQEPKFKVGDVLCDKSCTTLDKNSQPNIEILDIRDGMYLCNNCTFPISQQDEYELVAKRIEPQPAWSEEDENMANDLIEGFQSPVKAYYLVHTSKEIADWLKSIKDRIGG